VVEKPAVIETTPAPFQLTSPPSPLAEVVVEPLPSVEAIFGDAAEWIEPPLVVGEKVLPMNPEFPPCPVCGSARYWISKGKVMCGSRRCYSAVRFILTRIEYYPVH
jgi:hypothetical protein